MQLRKPGDSLKNDRASVVANLALWIVLGLVLANLLFNVGASADGASYPYTSFLALPGDRFADFFKLAFSYPGAPIHPAAGFWHVNDLLAHHMAEVKLYEGTNVNHFHEPPVPTLFAVTARWLMTLIDPVVLFLTLLIAAFAALFATVLRVAPAGRTGTAFATVIVLSYPALLAIDRGHFFSLICASLMIAATFRTLRGKADGWTILMFAIAVNLRPNMGIVPFVLLLGMQGLSFRNAIWLGLSIVAVFVGTMAVVHQVYPAYSYDSFLKGVGQYGMAYAGGENGYANGSSLYGMIRAPLGYAWWMPFVPFIVMAGLLAPTILEARQGRLRKSECLFLTLCAYVFGSHVFADYHLLGFIIPLILITGEDGPMDASAWTIVLASSLMLAPKNYVFGFHGGTAWSWQVIANPAILLSASVVVLWMALRRNSAVNDRREIEVAATV
jgi:hypothetical protein